VQRRGLGGAEFEDPWRDGTTRLVMLPLELMQPSIEWPVCGGQIHWFYVCCGSEA